METETLEFNQTLKLDKVEVWNFKNKSSYLENQSSLRVYSNKENSIWLLQIGDFRYALDPAMKIITSFKDDSNIQSFILPSKDGFYVLKFQCESNHPMLLDFAKFLHSYCQIINYTALSDHLNFGEGSDLGETKENEGDEKLSLKRKEAFELRDIAKELAGKQSPLDLSGSTEALQEHAKNQEKKEESPKDQASTKDSLSLENLDNPHPEESSSNLEQHNSFQILRKSFHDVTDVLAEGLDTVMNLLKPDELLEQTRQKATEKIQEMKEKIHETSEQLKHGALTTRKEGSEEHEHPHHHLSIDSKQFRPTEQSHHLVEEIIGQSSAQQPEKKEPHKGRQITKNQKRPINQTGERDEDEFWLAEETPSPREEAKEIHNEPETQIEERVPLLDIVTNRIESLSQTFSQIRSIFVHPHHEERENDDGSQSQNLEPEEEEMRNQEIIEREPEHSLGERLKGGFQGVRRKISETFETVRHKLHNEKEERVHCDTKEPVYEGEEKILYQEAGSLQDLDAVMEGKKNLESKRYQSAKEKTNKPKRFGGNIAGKFKNLKQRLFEKKTKEEEKEHLEFTPTKELNPEEQENFQHVKGGFSETLNEFKDEKRIEEIGQLSLQSGNPFKPFDNQEKSHKTELTFGKNLSTGVKEEKGLESQDQNLEVSPKKKRKHHSHNKNKNRVIGGDITNQMGEVEQEVEGTQTEEKETETGFKRFSRKISDSYERFKEAFGPVEEDVENPKAT